MMDDSDIHKLDGVLPELRKSIFPTFDVDVPMPGDTAVPGSSPAPAPSSGNHPQPTEPDTGGK